MATGAEMTETDLRGEPSRRINVNRFRYRRVDVRFPEELATHLENHESVLLLGPRYVGKRHVLSRVRGVLKERKLDRIVELHLMERNWLDKSLAMEAVSRAVEGGLRGMDWQPTSDPRELLDTLRRFLERTACHVVALIADVDALPDHLARRLLKGIRELSTLPPDCPGHLSVLLTGSIGLTPLVHGADSEFDCTQQYVIQGFDREAFERYVLQTLEPTGWRLDRREQCCDLLYELCGGNVHMLRALFWGLLEGRRIHGQDRALPLSCTEIEEAGKHLYSPMSTPVDFISQTVSRIESSPESCQMVAELLDEDRLRLDALPATPETETEGNPPTEIELGGLAVREDGHLKFASRMMKDMAVHYFSHWRLGDLFACGQKWDEAFTHYEAARREEGEWVYSPTRRPQLPSAVRAFEVALHAKASEGVEAFDGFFSQGARNLLGFQEIGFWQHGKHWEQIAPSTPEAEAREVHDKSLAFLPSPGILHSGVHPLEEDLAQFALLVGLPPDKADKPTERRATVLSNFGNEVPLTRERLALCLQAIESYCTAFAAARRIARVTQETMAQRHLLETVPLILEAVAQGKVTTLTALETAADRLRDIGYRRVMFSMVDPARTEIVGLFDSRPEGEPDMAALSRWRLDGPIVDVQQHCVRHCKTILVEDAMTHPITDKAIAERAGVKGQAVIPIHSHGQVLATFHVERADKRMPHEGEVRLLEYFAAQLARVIRLTERVRMVEASLNAGKDPVCIVDRGLAVRYVNTSLAREVDLTAGWQNEASPPPAEERLWRKSVELLDRAMGDNRPVSKYLQNARERNSRWWHLEAVSINDWRRMPIGGLLQAHDVTATRQMVETLQELASCQDVDELLAKLLKAASKLGHRWGRAYMIDERGRLVGCGQFGFAEGSKGAVAFERGEAVLPASDEPGSVSWRCFDVGKPVIFCLSREHGDGETIEISSGLAAMNVHDPRCPTCLKKTPGEVWIDFPLYCRGTGQRLGKLTLSGSEDFEPERFEQLCVLAEIASTVIAALTQREHRARQELTMQRDAMEKAIGATVHYLLNRVAALGLLKMRFDDATTKPKELEGLNDEFERLLKSLADELEHIQDRLRPLEIRCQHIDLMEGIREIFSEQLPDAWYSLVPEKGRVTADVDPVVLRDMLCELIENSRKANAGERDLFVSVSVRVRGAPGDERCTIEFSDNGPGIPPQLRDRVFEDLYSARPGKRRGIGLGLGFVRRGIAAHGGTIRLRDPEDGEGACFVIEFPRFTDSKQDVD